MKEVNYVGFEPTTSAEIIVVSAIIGITARATEEILWRESIYEISPDQNSLPLYILRFGLLCGISHLGLSCQIGLLAESPPFSLMLYCLEYRGDMLLGRM